MEIIFLVIKVKDFEILYELQFKKCSFFIFVFNLEAEWVGRHILKS